MNVSANPRRPAYGRRRFLRDAGTLTGGAIALPFARGTHAQAGTIRTERLSDTLLGVLGPDANCVVADTADGLVVVDGGHARWSAALLEIVTEEFPGRPIRALLNTHWHPEQTGSNVALGQRGAEIVAHENTALWLGTEVRVQWSGETFPPLPAAGRPTRTFLDSGSFDFGRRSVDYGYMLNAHTDGDIWVGFADDGVIVSGGHVSNAGWPVIDWWTGGWIAGMLDGYDALLAVTDDDTRIVPAVGPLMSRRDLESQQRMYATVFERLQEMLRKGLGTDEVVAAGPTAEFDAEWGDPTQFVTLAFHSMWKHLRDADDKRLKNIA